MTASFNYSDKLFSLYLSIFSLFLNDKLFLSNWLLEYMFIKKMSITLSSHNYVYTVLTVIRQIC